MPSSRPVQAGDHVFLVDGSSFIFRAYFQSMNQDQKYNARSSDGMPSGAVRLFCSKLLQFLRDGAAGLKPTHLAIVLDKSEGSHRKELYEDYKGHRPDAPDDLKVQMPIMREAIRAFGMEPVELERYEAAVTERWEGIPPEKIGDVLALMGDTSDNVPGVPGIGLKTAAQLIREFGDLETLLARAGEIKQPKRRETLIANADKARLSKQLVTLDQQAPLPVPLDELSLPEPDPRALVAFLRALEFNTLTRRIG